MIISHKHGFIFIRAQKTASTSLQVALACQCGEDDIVTDIPLELSELTKGRTKYYGADLAKVHRSRNAENAKAHAFPEDIIKQYGQDLWDRYFKIVVVRNPWDLAFSQFNFARKVTQRGSRLELTKHFGIGSENTHKYYFVNGIDFGNKTNGRYLIFENLDADYKSVCQTLKLNYTPLPKCKTTYRNPATRDYRKFVSEDRKNLIDKTAGKIIEYFGYEFDKPNSMPKWVWNPNSKSEI